MTMLITIFALAPAPTCAAVQDVLRKVVENLSTS